MENKKSRTTIIETKSKIGESVYLKGWITNRRDHGKIVFLDVRDRTGEVQVVVIPGSGLYELLDDLRDESVVAISGLVKERPEKMKNNLQPLGGLEIEGIEGVIYAKPRKPFPFSTREGLEDLHLETLLDNRSLTVRNHKIKAIFKIYHTLIAAYGDFLRENDFTEIKTPKIVGGATEGGSNVFSLNYFERKAFLAQSPQFYKQILAGSFERVFEIGPVFRAEHHFTSRHVNEYTSLDAEMAFIDDETDVMMMLEKLLGYVFEQINTKNKAELSLFGIESVKIPTNIPQIPLAEALEVVKNKREGEQDGFDIDPLGEKLVSDYVLEKYSSEFVFLTKYPVSVRPFYHLTYPDQPNLTRSFDLIYRGLELATGAQRINEYEMLLDSIKKHDLDPNSFSDYLEPFKYGMPPHGGWGMSGERIVQKMLGLKNIREAVLFPRDVRRLSP